MPVTTRQTKRAEVGNGEGELAGLPVAQDNAAGNSLQADATQLTPSLDSRYIPSRHAMSILDVVYMVLSHLKDMYGWNEVFNHEFWTSAEERTHVFTTIKSILDLKYVGKVWREAVSLPQSLCAVVPVTMIYRESCLKGCLSLSGEAQLTVTMWNIEERVGPEIWKLLDGEQNRIANLRISCTTPKVFVERMHAVPVAITALPALTSLYVKATAPRLLHTWISTPTPQLHTLRLKNFMFMASCGLPNTLRSLQLEYSDTVARLDSRFDGEIMDLSNLLKVLSRLGLLERLVLDIRFTPGDKLTDDDHASLPNLKQLTVRAHQPRHFNGLTSHIVCPPLDYAYLIVDLHRGDAGEVAGDLTAASTKLSALSLKGRNASDRIELAHIYVDERGCPVGRNRYDNRCQTTVAATTSRRHIPLTNDKTPIDSIVSTSPFVLTVTRPADEEWVTHRDPSSVLRMIFAGLPSCANVESLTVYCRPGLLVWPLEESEEAGPDDAVLAFANASIFDCFASARRLNWLGNGGQLADILRQPKSFPHLNYLAHALPHNGEFNVRLEEAVEKRKESVRAAVNVDGLKKQLARKLKKGAWLAPLLLPETVVNVANMFDQLLDTVGRRVL